MGDQDTGATPDPTAGAMPATSEAGATPATTAGASSAAEPLGAKGTRALQAEREARRDAEQRAQQFEARVAELEAASLRREVAASKGVPDHLLSGETREDLEAMADQMLEWKNGPHVPVGRPKEARLGLPKEAPLINGAAPGRDPEPDAGQVVEGVLNRRRVI